MSRIRSKNTRAELLLRKTLWQQHVRFRIHPKEIEGKPDIVIRKYRLVIFIDGGFWHGYNWENNKHKFRTNADFWIAKIEGNIRRDIKVNQTLRQQGYTVMRFWDHEIFSHPERCVNQVLLYIESSRLGTIPEND